ncbi:MAG: hypothetical protein ABEJ87_01320 [Candidatus Nanohalobium sp.]
MSGRIGFGRILFAVLFLAVLVSPAAATWDLSIPNHVNTNSGSIFTSNGKKTVVFVKIQTNHGEPILPSDVTDSSEFVYEYNKSSGSSKQLKHYQGAFWYADFNADITKHDISGDKAQILFEAHGDRSTTDGVDSGGWQNTTAALQVNNYTVNITDGIESPINPGDNVNMTVNVSDRDGVNAPGVQDVYAYFRNSTNDLIGKKTFSYNSTTGLYNVSITPPLTHDEKYLMRVIAKNKTSKTYGSVSRWVTTTKDIHGNIENFTGLKGCDRLQGQPVAANCEPGGSMDLSFNVTGVPVDNVTLSTYKVNRSSSEQQQIMNKTLGKSEGLYQGQVSVPGINTSAFENKVIVKIEMNKGDRSKTIHKTISYKALKLVHTGGRTTSQGQDYDLGIQALRPISLSPYGASALDSLKVNVTTPSGNLYRNYSKSDLSFDDGKMVFDRKVNIGQNAESGGWDVSAKGSIYAQSDSLNSGFSVASSDASIQVNDTEYFMDERGEKDVTLDVKNLITSNITIKTNVSSQLRGILNISEDGRFNVSAGAKKSVPVTIQKTDLADNVHGQVNFTDVDTGYQTQASARIQTLGCMFSNGSLCSTTGKWINISADSRDTKQGHIEIYYTAGEGKATNVTVSKQGSIASFIDINKTKYEVKDGLTIDLNYTPVQRGNFTGNIILEADNGSVLRYNTSLEANVTAQGEILSTNTSTVQLGTLPEGSSENIALQIQNTGSLDVNNLIAKSQRMDAGLDNGPVDLPAGSSKTVTVSLSNINSMSSIIFTGSKGQGSNASTTVQAQGTVVQNYSAKAGDLRGRIRGLRPVSKSNLSDTLQKVDGMIGAIKDQWSNEKYTEARNTYSQAQVLLDYVSNHKGTDTSGNTGNTGSPGDTGKKGSQGGGNNPPGSGGDQNQGGQQQKKESGGGLPILPIVAVVLVLVIVGAVVYESYIPEEGDPLYGLLGEE